MYLFLKYLKSLKNNIAGQFNTKTLLKNEGWGARMTAMKDDQGVA